MTAPDMNSTVAIRARRFEIAMIGTPSNEQDRIRRAAA
jgi:hypothetical protein